MNDEQTSQPQRNPGGGAAREAVRARLTWPPSLPFSDVLARAQALDQSAIGMLYNRFLPVIYRFTLARVANPQHAEDLTADTFFAMIEGIATARAKDELGFAAWLLGIARNKIALHFRRGHEQDGQRAELTERDEPRAVAEEDDPLAIITARESWAEVVHALNRLTEEQRTVVLYRCVLGYSTEEVAQLLDKQPGTIRALQFRALASLARYLGESPQASLDERPSRAPERERRRGHASRG